MKNLALFIIFFAIASCASQKKVFWCGDHVCKNKKEREVYFKKTMTVEIKSPKNIKKKEITNVEKIILNEDKKKKIKKNKSEINSNINKQAQKNEKRRINEEKRLAKQAKLNEKIRLKEEKKLSKQLKLEEKRRLKEEEKLSKILKNKKKKKVVKSNENLLSASTSIDVNYNDEFDVLVKKITDKNLYKPFPDINDIPN